MNTINILWLKKVTKLPLKFINLPNKPTTSFFIETPTGTKTIELKETHYPFIFGSVTQTDISDSEIISEILKIDRDAKDHLLDEWLKTLK